MSDAKACRQQRMVKEERFGFLIENLHKTFTHFGRSSLTMELLIILPVATSSTSLTTLSTDTLSFISTRFPSTAFSTVSNISSDIVVDTVAVSSNNTGQSRVIAAHVDTDICRCRGVTVINHIGSVRPPLNDIRVHRSMSKLVTCWATIFYTGRATGTVIVFSPFTRNLHD